MDYLMDFGFSHQHPALNKNELFCYLTSFTFNEHRKDEILPCPWKKSCCFNGDKILPFIES